MFDHGEAGYHEYRATQSGGESDNKEGWSPIAMAVSCITGLLFWGFIALFIGSFLYHAM